MSAELVARIMDRHYIVTLDPLTELHDLVLCCPQSVRGLMQRDYMRLATEYKALAEKMEDLAWEVKKCYEDPKYAEYLKIAEQERTVERLAKEYSNGASKVNLIKLYRELYNVSLKEAFTAVCELYPNAK